MIAVLAGPLAAAPRSRTAEPRWPSPPTPTFRLPAVVGCCPATLDPGRAGVYDLRRASNLPLGARVERQVERDALVHRLRQLDDQLVRISEERKAVVDALAEVRERPLPAGAVGQGAAAPRHRPSTAARRPPRARSRCEAATCAPPASPSCAATAALALPELHGLVHRYGYLVGAARPVQALADAMAYEVERGRARRPERGVYEAHPVPPTDRAHPARP